jgi:hypothetical protein
VTSDQRTEALLPTAIVRTTAELDHALASLMVPRNVPAIVLIGAASGMTDEHAGVAHTAICAVVGPVAAEIGAVVVDGGTDSGVMRLAGEARAEQSDRFVLVGVVARDLVRLGREPDGSRVPLEPRHSGIVVVPGEQWGDETRWLFDVAEAVAGDRPIRTVLVNGGRITHSELSESIRRAIPVVVVRGTGRTADELELDPLLDGTAAPYDRSLLSVAEASDTEGLRSMLRDALRSDAPRIRGQGSNDDGPGS